MISVLLWCYSRQNHLDLTLPKWLAQTGVDFELVIGCGPSIKLPDDKRIRRIEAPPPPKMGRAYNLLLEAANGDTLLVTQADMEVNDPEQLARMYAKSNYSTMVTEKFFKNGKRDSGIFLQFMMIPKQRVIDVGGWAEVYDCPALAAHEDTDLMCRLLTAGMDLIFFETPEDKGVYHIHHGTPYDSDHYKVRIANGKAVFNSRNKLGIISLVIKMFARHMREKREGKLMGSGYAKI
jgi:glycosyltransferase involved in cell wall biosynthesis